jgi:hypothetical protein
MGKKIKNLPSLFSVLGAGIFRTGICLARRTCCCVKAEAFNLNTPIRVMLSITPEKDLIDNWVQLATDVDDDF